MYRNRYNTNHQNHINSFNTPTDLSKKNSIRQRLIQRNRTEQSSESNINRNNRNYINTSFQQRELTQTVLNDENNSLISNTSRNNFHHNYSFNNKDIMSSPFNNLRKLSQKSISKNNLNEIEEEKHKEENIASEIKDTVKCYICFKIITKPKMCPHCHKIACEKCLYNWFMIDHKKVCQYCNEKVNFYEMISVPFMSTVVDFVEKFIEKDKEVKIKNKGESSDFCSNHSNEKLYYYCLDCKKGYCKTCFVFFGKEKDKHLKHNIIKYEQYKNMNLTSINSFDEKINYFYNKTKKIIQRCLSYKNAYEFERVQGNKLIDNLKKEFNEKIEENISIINEQIKKLNQYLETYENYKNELNNYYSKNSNKNKNISSCQNMSLELFNKLSKITSNKLYSSKEIENLCDLSKNIKVKTYQSKLTKLNHENMFVNKSLKMGDSPYNLIIDNKKRNEVNISLIIPKEKLTCQHNFIAFVFIRKKGNEAETYELNEKKEDDNFYYYMKKIPWDYLGESIYKIKGLLYDYYFV